MQARRVLVLGASGRIGAVLRRCWPENRPRMQVLWQARRPAGQAPGPGADWAILDPLADAAALARAASGSAVILCLAGVTPARTGQGAAMADNTALACAAIRAGAASGARVLLASSAAVYGDRAGLLRETMAPTPASDYGRAKAAMETRAAALAADLGVPVTALRIGNIAGLDAILGGWRPGFALDRFADGRTPRRSYIGPVTLARVLGDLACAEALPGVLNIAAPGVVEMGALLDAAHLDWTPRTPAATAIPEVRLSTAALDPFTALSAADGQPETLVAEWRGMT